MTEMGIYPPVWGNYQWAMLHLMAETYPESPNKERQENMILYLRGMSANLPCPGCSIHAEMYMKSNPPTVTNREDLIRYFINFHNSVNKRLGTKVYAYDEARQLIRDNFFKLQDWRRLKQEQAEKKLTGNSPSASPLTATSKQEKQEIDKSNKMSTAEISIIVLLSVFLVVLIAFIALLILKTK